jgi:hypothetical protein
MGVDHTWKMRFLRRRALVCVAKLGGLDAAAAAEASISITQGESSPSLSLHPRFELVELESCNYKEKPY